MYIAVWRIFLYLLLLLIPMVYLQRFLQREIQAIFLLITRQPDISMALFSLLFLPGVFLHEASHYIMALVLGVRTGRFSIIPRKLEGGRIRLGYVETAQTDFFRDAMIGIAPLVTGGLFVAFAGVYRLGLDAIWVSIIQGQLRAISLAIKTAAAQPDFWLWFYLVFAVSSTMMPSESDRRGWIPVILVMASLLGIILIIGVGPWMITNFGKAFLTAMNAVTLVFGITVMIHLIFLPPAWVIRKIISRILGLQVV
jgi:hypothetical protein